MTPGSKEIRQERVRLITHPLCQQGHPSKRALTGLHPTRAGSSTGCGGGGRSWGEAAEIWLPNAGNKCFTIIPSCSLGGKKFFFAKSFTGQSYWQKSWYHEQHQLFYINGGCRWHGVKNATFIHSVLYLHMSSNTIPAARGLRLYYYPLLADEKTDVQR